MGDACAGESPVVTRPMPALYEDQSETSCDVYLTSIPEVRAATASTEGSADSLIKVRRLIHGPAILFGRKPSPDSLDADEHGQACSQRNKICILRLASVFLWLCRLCQRLIVSSSLWPWHIKCSAGLLHSAVPAQLHQSGQSVLWPCLPGGLFPLAEPSTLISQTQTPRLPWLVAFLVSCLASVHPSGTPTALRSTMLVWKSFVL